MSSLVKQQGQQKADVYLNFVNSIKSDVTRKIYEYNLRLFMEFCGIDKFEDLIGRQNQIIAYLMSLRERENYLKNIQTILKKLISHSTGSACMQCPNPREFCDICPMALIRIIGRMSLRIFCDIIELVHEKDKLSIFNFLM
jgi:hypothetical protein